MFRSKKAIAALNRHMVELDNVTSTLQGNTWKSSLKDLLNLYLGPDSSILTRLDKLYFTRKQEVLTDFGPFSNHHYDDTKKENFRHLIQGAIKHIDTNGVYRNQSRSNFLSGFKNVELISGIVIGVGIIISACNYFGQFQKEREISELNKVIDVKEKKIQQLNNEQSSELNNCKIENQNLWDSYHKVYAENEKLKKSGIKKK